MLVLQGSFFDGAILRGIETHPVVLSSTSSNFKVSLQRRDSPKYPWRPKTS